MKDRPQSVPFDQSTTEDYQQLIDSFAQAVWQTDAAGIIVDDSLTWRSYTGQTLDQWLSEGWIAAIHPDDHQDALKQWKQSLQNQTPLNAEIRLQSAEGGWRWTNVRVTPVYNPNGSIRKWIGLLIDITEKKQVKAIPAPSEEQFRAFVTATSDVVYQMSADWRAMHQLIGKSFLSDTDTTNVSWLEQYIPLPDRERVQATINQAIQTKRPFELAHRVIQTDGSIGWTFSRAIPILNVRGEITEWFGTARDITHQTQAEESLRQSEVRYHTLFNSIDEGFCMIEVLFDERNKPVDCRILDINSSYLKMTGAGREVVGHRLRACRPRIEERVIERYGQVALTGESIRFEEYVSDLDRWFDCYALRIGGEGSYTLAVTFNDITKRKRQQQQEAILTEISQKLTSLNRIEQTMEQIGCIIGQHFDVTWCMFSELVNHNETAVASYGWSKKGVPLLKGSYRMRDFWNEDQLTKSNAGELAISSDTQADPTVNAERYGALGIRAFITVPLARDGQWQFQMSIIDNKPRQWQADEIELMRELTYHTWTRLERTRVEEALKDSEKRLQLTTEAAQLATWEWNLTTNMVYWNKQHFWLFGMTPQQEPLNSEVFVNHVYGQDRSRISDSLRRAIQDQSLYDADFRIVRDDGAIRWMHGYGRLTDQQAGQPLRMSGIMFDITDRKEAEEALRASEARQHAILESAKDYAIFTTDLTRRINSWNRGAQAVFGYAEADIMHQFADLLFTPEDQQTGVPQYEAQKATNLGRAENERWHIRKDGSRFYGSGVVTPLRDGSGTTIGLLKVMRDLTTQKQAEEDLKEADRRKDEFLAMLAHELRNPMATIRNGLTLLNLSSTPDAVTRQAVAMMNRQVDHLVHMVDDLLDVSRISRGKIALKSERVELGALLAGTVKAIWSQYEARQKQLHLAPLPKGLYLRGDATRLNQIITNLLTNGLRYTGDQGQVWVSLTAKNGEAVLRIADNGIGLSSEQLTTIFDLFVQVDGSLARSQDGLGVGLTLAKRLVELHKGRLEAYSSGLGQGSEFVIHLPLLNESRKGMSLTDTDRTAKAAGQRILVIDDNSDAALTLSMLLKMKGYEVYSCHSGREGIQAAETFMPTLILCDIGMPDLDGYQTCRLIRQQPWGKTMRIVALTGYGQEEDKRHTKEAGFDDHLVKPVDLSVVTQLLTNLPTY